MSATAGDRTNILWLSCHDISPDLGCYDRVWPGADYAHTPNLDRLAAEGARYDNAFAVAPVCAPSRSSIITGTYPTAIGTMHMRSRAIPPPEVRPFPEYLRAAGYYCTNNYFTDYNFATPVTVWDESSPQAHWRNRPDPTQPFFAVFCSVATHESRIDTDDEQHHRNTAALAPEERHDPDGAPLPPYYPDTPTMRRAWARYSDNVTAMDHWAGDLLRQLDDDGLAANTLVLFWSDHGRGLPRAKRWPYDSGLREPLLVRWPGRIAPGTVRVELASLMDLGPTVLAAAGLPVPEQMHGRPLFDARGVFSPHPRSYVFGHRDRIDEAEDTMRTARDDHFRYIRNYHPDRPYALHSDYSDRLACWRELRRLRWEEATLRAAGEEPTLLTPVQRHFLATTKPPEELYDLAADPHETRNLADDPRHAPDLRRFREALNDWQRTYGDLGLVPEEELIARWRPGGIQPTTEPPQVRIEAGQLVARCPTPGASIAWTIDPPGAPPAPGASSGSQLAGRSLADITGDPQTGGRTWRLYSGPVAAVPGARLWFRACRLGYRDSDDVAVAGE